MNLKNRLTKLLMQAGALAKKQRQKVLYRRCKGRTLQEILDEVVAACPQGCLTMLEEVIEQLLDYEERHGDGEDRTAMYDGFLIRLFELQEGNATLPKVLPAAVVRCWHRLYAENRGRSPVDWHVPFPFFRCADCLFALPDHPDRDHGSIGWQCCPVCSSPKLCWANLARDAGQFHEWQPPRGK